MFSHSCRFCCLVGFCFFFACPILLELFQTTGWAWYFPLQCPINLNYFWIKFQLWILSLAMIHLFLWISISENIVSLWLTVYVFRFGSEFVNRELQKQKSFRHGFKASSYQRAFVHVAHRCPFENTAPFQNVVNPLVWGVNKHMFFSGPLDLSDFCWSPHAP